MKDEELDDGGVCGLCGEPVSLSDPSHFWPSESSLVCHACAKRYGGAYDSENECWRVSPRLPAPPEADRDEW